MHDQFPKIEWLKTRFDLGGDAKKVVVGIGDDAAVIDFSRKEVFQPHLPVRLPCYDLALVTSFTLGGSLR